MNPLYTEPLQDKKSLVTHVTATTPKGAVGEALRAAVEKKA